MNLTRCEKGHFYDADRFDTCPHCNDVGGAAYDATVSMPMATIASEVLKTEPLEATILQSAAVPEKTESGQETVGYFQGSIGLEPVVGWLVCIEGNHFGEDFKLRAGKNFIGRASDMDVCLSGDSSVSREKHSIIVFEPKESLFIVQPGDSKELSYLNGQVILTPAQIKSHDVISVGNTKLMFIPFCTNEFKWQDAKSANE